MTEPRVSSLVDSVITSDAQLAHDSNWIQRRPRSESAQINLNIDNRQLN